ncbi:MAG TPA: hypothetical protein ENK49_13555 [Gammaproteobacteria bacterium]|nr:hypothetical protein [Gammaproteobacteria bacterium]
MRSICLRFIFASFALLALAGAQCAFVASSGNHDRDKEDGSIGNGLIVVINDGRLVDGPVQGVRYTSGSVSGITGADGEFRYEAGKTIQFSIGSIALGEVVTAKPLMTPLDLVPGGSLDTPAVINIARLLQSLDAVPGDRRITIPATLRSAAGAGREPLVAAIRSLDFADDTAFVNAASQLVATLTANYGFTAVLVDAETARQHLQDTLDGL